MTTPTLLSKEQQIRAIALQAAASLVAGVTISDGQKHEDPIGGLSYYTTIFEAYIKTGVFEEQMNQAHNSRYEL